MLLTTHNSSPIKMRRMFGPTLNVSKSPTRSVGTDRQPHTTLHRRPLTRLPFLRAPTRAPNSCAVLRITFVFPTPPPSAHRGRVEIQQRNTRTTKRNLFFVPRRPAMQQAHARVEHVTYSSRRGRDATPKQTQSFKQTPYIRNIVSCFDFGLHARPRRDKT